MLHSNASYQFSQKLFLCGGFGATEQTSSEFYSFDAQCKAYDLAPLPQNRHATSLCGSGLTLLALGGMNQAHLQICDCYSLHRNKWKTVAPLTEPKSSPGSCLLPSLRAFCFCGTQGVNERLNSVESLELGCSLDWKSIGLKQKLVKTYHLTGVQRRGEILLFGGASNSAYVMYRLSEEGEVLQNQSESCGEIPGVMCGGVSLSLREGVYAIGYRKSEGALKEARQFYDGIKWKPF